MCAESRQSNTHRSQMLSLGDLILVVVSTEYNEYSVILTRRSKTETEGHVLRTIILVGGVLACRSSFNVRYYSRDTT
jgi:hypothetical protein